MNVFHKLTLESLKKNKTRTIVTIIGIILSTAMICAVASLSSSFHNYLVNVTKCEKGSWHVALEETDTQGLEKLENDKRTKQVAYAKEEGYAKVTNAKGEETMLFVLGAADGFENTMPIHMVNGHYPTNENEIIVPTHLAKSREVYYNVGDQITLNLGKRMYNGGQLHQSNNFYYPDEKDDGETFENIGEKSYTVVGVYERPSFETFDAIGYTVITKLNGELALNDSINAYAELKNPLLAAKMSSEIDKSKINNSLLQLYGIGFSEDSQMTTVFACLISIILVLIIFASVALIYNAFSISVSERTKQFGLLSSLGATKKQIKKMVNFEALVLSLIGIPIGIIAGLIGIDITLYFIGDKIASTALVNYGVNFDFYVHPIFIIGAVILSLITIYISAYKPSVRATKVTAIEAIRQTKDINIKKTKIKTPKWVYKLYGLPGMLANKNYKRSAKKYRATVLSLTMSIILFISASSLTSYMVASLDVTGIPKSDVELFMLTNDSEQIYDKVKTVPSADATALVKQTGAHEHLYNDILFVDDDNFKELLKENGLFEKEYMDKNNPKALVFKPIRKNTNTFFLPIDENALKTGKTTLNFPKKMDGYQCFSVKDENTNETFIEYISKSDDNDDKRFKISEVSQSVNVDLGKQIKNVPYYIPQYIENDALIFPLSLQDSVIPKDAAIRDKDIFSTVRCLAKEHKKCETEIIEVLDEIEKETPLDYTYHTQDIAQMMEINKNLIFVMRVFCYGFVALLTLISAANVFNTISTNIALRKRELAMLQSIGMTNKEMHKMMRFECMKYGMTSLLIGVPISLIITVLIHLTFANEFEMSFRFPTLAIIICVISIFTLVFATMLYSMNKIKKQNTIEALKDENQ